MAAVRAPGDSHGGRLVFALLAFLSRRGRVGAGAGPIRRSCNRMAMGPALRSRDRPTSSAAPQTYEQELACRGKWTYLYRAVDSTGARIDFLLSARRDAAAAKRFFQKALRSPNHPTPRVINVDKNPSYPPVVEELKSEGTLRRRCQLRPVQYLNNIVEQDHRAIKRRVRASQGFRSFWGAWRTILKDTKQCTRF